MNKSEITETITSIVVFQLGLSSNPKVDDVLSDFDMDSLDEIELIMLIEDRFDIDIADHEVDNILTISNIVGLVSEKLCNE